MSTSSYVSLKKYQSLCYTLLANIVILIFVVCPSAARTAYMCNMGEWDCLDGNDIVEHSCIPQRQLCNTVPDCPDGSDEGGLCGNCNKYGCQRICLDTPSGPVCRCNIGETVGSDLKSCVDVDECATETAKCGHFCSNTIGSYTCSCYLGYNLASNGHDCQLNNSESVRLIISINEMLIKVPLTGENQRVAQSESAMKNSVPMGSRVQKLDYSATDDRVVMIVDGITHWHQSFIYSVQHEKAKCVVQNLFFASAVAVDWITNNIYYATDGASQRTGVGACTKDGRYCRLLLRGDEYDMHRFRDLVLHSRRGLMFLLVAGKDGFSRIEMASMNGQGHKIVVNEVTIRSADGWASLQAIAIDNIKERLFYVILFEDTRLIGIVDITSGKFEDFTVPLEKSFNNHGLPYNFLFYNDNIFWTDWRRSTVMMASIKNFEPQIVLNFTSHAKQHYFVGGLTISHEMYHQKFQPDPCETAECSHMCLLNHTSRTDSPTATCLCPDHYFIDENDARQCRQVGDQDHGELELEMAPEICTSLLLEYCRNGSACYNGGECVTVRSIGGQLSSVTCECRAGFHGLYCEVNLSETSSISVVVVVIGSLVLLVLMILGILYFAKRSDRFRCLRLRTGGNRDIAVRYSASSTTELKSDSFVNPICEEDISSVFTTRT